MSCLPDIFQRYIENVNSPSLTLSVYSVISLILFSDAFPEVRTSDLFIDKIKFPKNRFKKSKEFVYSYCFALYKRIFLFISRAYIRLSSTQSYYISGKNVWKR